MLLLECEGGDFGNFTWQIFPKIEFLPPKSMEFNRVETIVNHPF